MDCRPGRFQTWSRNECGGVNFREEAVLDCYIDLEKMIGFLAGARGTFRGHSLDVISNLVQPTTHRCTGLQEFSEVGLAHGCILWPLLFITCTDALDATERASRACGRPHPVGTNPVPTAPGTWEYSTPCAPKPDEDQRGQVGGNGDPEKTWEVQVPGSMARE